MYGRAIRNLFVASGQILNRSEHVFKSFAPTITLLSQRATERYNTNSIIFLRSCTTTSPPQKEDIAAAKLEEYLKDPANEKHYKVLQLEIEVMRQCGDEVPMELKARHWMELIQLDSRSKRRRYIKFLFGIEKKRENEVAKRRLKSEEKKSELDAIEDDGTPDYMKYRLGGNAMFLRFYDSSMNFFYNWRLIRSMMFGQKLVMDCGYEDKMSRIEMKNCAKQMMLSFAANRYLDDPFDLVFCNLNPSGDLHSEFYSFIPTMYQPEFPITITSKSYLDLYDKNSLVYLTPDCHDEMKEFDEDAIYIIGAIVDKMSGHPTSLAKAKREGLRMAKLPIDRYLDFGGGSGKSLTLNQMVDILGDVKRTKDWSYAMRHVPRRKLYSSRQASMERRAKKFLESNENHVLQSSVPQDFSIGSRKKFRNK